MPNHLGLIMEMFLCTLYIASCKCWRVCQGSCTYASYWPCKLKEGVDEMVLQNSFYRKNDMAKFVRKYLVLYSVPMLSACNCHLNYSVRVVIFFMLFIVWWLKSRCHALRLLPCSHLPFLTWVSFAVTFWFPHYGKSWYQGCYSSK